MIKSQDARAAAQVTAASKRHYTLVEPLRTAVASVADALELKAVVARREAVGLQPTCAKELRWGMLRAEASSPDRVCEFMTTTLPPAPPEYKRIAEAAHKTKAARVADGQATTLRSSLVGQPLVKLKAVEAVAPDYPEFAQVLAPVSEAIGLTFEKEVA